MQVGTIQNSLNALKSMGSVYGVILVREQTVIYSDCPYGADKVKQLAGSLDDISFYFTKERRQVDQVSFGYDSGNVVIVMDDPHRLVLFHSSIEDVDLIAKSAKAFLLDYQMGMFTEAFAKKQSQQQAYDTVAPPDPTTQQIRSQVPQRPGTQRISLKAEQGFDQTAPIQPLLDPAAGAAPRPQARGR